MIPNVDVGSSNSSRIPIFEQDKSQEITLQLGGIQASNFARKAIGSSANDRLLRKLQIVQGGADTPVPDTTDDEFDEKDDLSGEDTMQNEGTDEEFYEAEDGKN